jgi:hypothetical protein
VEETYSNENFSSSTSFYMLTSFFLLAIERNFSGREIQVFGREEKNTNSCIRVKEEFIRSLVKDEQTLKRFKENTRLLDFKNSPTKMISMNLCDEQARHLMIFVEGTFYVEEVMEAIKKYQLERQIDGKKMYDEKKIVFLNNKKQPILNLINDFNEYVSEGYTVIMFNMDIIYASLYDLFNQKYMPNPGDPKKKLCQIAHGTTVNTVSVDSNFKCVVLMEKPPPEHMKKVDDFEERWPTALLNRFEKHILTLDELVDEKSYWLVMKSIALLEKGKVVPDKFIHNWSELLIESSVANTRTSSKIELRVKDHKQAVEDFLIKDASKTDEFAQASERPVLSTNLAQSLDYIHRVDEAELFEKLMPLLNSNYLYFLVQQFRLPEQKPERDNLFEKFFLNKKNSSLKNLIQNHASRMNSDTSNQAYVAFSLADPYQSGLRELIENDADIREA